MNIVQVTHHVWPCTGGIESFVLGLSKELKRKGHNVKIVCLDKCADGKKLKAFERVKGISVHRIPFTDLKLYKLAPSVLEFAKDVDIIHVHNIGFFSDFLAWTKSEHGAKLVLNTHGGIDHTQSFSWLKHAYKKTFLKKALKQFDAILCDSVDDFEAFKKFKNAKLVENGVELQPFLQSKTKKISQRLLFVGRLSSNKRIDLLLKMFAIVEKDFPKVELRIVGGDWKGEERKLKTLAKTLELKRVRFVGKASEKELEREFARASFLVSASSHEGFGISVLEGMAAGCIPLLNDIPSFRRFAASGRGTVLDFSDSGKAAKILEKWLEKGEKELKPVRKKCNAFAKGFDWKKKVAEYERVYESVRA